MIKVKQIKLDSYLPASVRTDIMAAHMRRSPGTGAQDRRMVCNLGVAAIPWAPAPKQELATRG